MELLQETYTFKNQEGKDIEAKRYYVNVYDTKVYLVCKEKQDKRFLDSYLNRKVKE